ncbi:hypothetical protein F2P81_007492 [Scophthalmus maximus]|uniref:Uncharacterized protein n=1 Tax=Scophthalmus maximus TaxID=52904 RepID=A0A6A4SZV8_SCOMX|nr:hypothetical protein F2P81_007492 [Scophthalmus maximus]
MLKAEMLVLAQITDGVATCDSGLYLLPPLAPCCTDQCVSEGGHGVRENRMWWFSKQELQLIDLAEDKTWSPGEETGDVSSSEEWETLEEDSDSDEMSVVPFNQKYAWILCSPSAWRTVHDAVDTEPVEPPRVPEKTEEYRHQTYCCLENNYTKIAILFRYMNMGVVEGSTFFKVQVTYCIDTIKDFWHNKRVEVVTRLQSKDNVVILGDCRMYSPGFCAQYCTYTAMGNDTKEILSIVNIDKRETLRELCDHGEGRVHPKFREALPGGETCRSVHRCPFSDIRSLHSLSTAAFNIIQHDRFGGDDIPDAEGLFPKPKQQESVEELFFVSENSVEAKFPMKHTQMYWSIKCA